MKEETSFAQLWVSPDIIEASAIKGACAADDAVDFVALGQEEFSEIGAILAGDAGNESFLGHKYGKCQERGGGEQARTDA